MKSRILLASGFLIFAFTALFLFSACSTGEVKPLSNRVPFSYFNETLIVIPISIDGGAPRKFILDTGIGVNLISKSLCAKLGCKSQSEFVGKRMSGQDVHIPMSKVASFAIGNKQLSQVPVGIFDIESMIPGCGIDGFVSLGFFKDFPFTIDYQKHEIVFENSDSLSALRLGSARVKIKLDVQGPSLDVFMPLTLPNGASVSAEVDTGSQALILDEHYMRDFGIRPDSKKIRRSEGKDETGHPYSRYLTSLDGDIHLPDSPQIVMKNPKILFQKIIYDGLVGHDFLSRFRVTFDIANSELLFGPN